MPINLEAVGTTSVPVERSWSSTDCLLYALGVGAGSLDASDFELEYTTENSADRRPEGPAHLRRRGRWRRAAPCDPRARSTRPCSSTGSSPSSCSGRSPRRRPSAPRAW